MPQNNPHGSPPVWFLTPSAKPSDRLPHGDERPLTCLIVSEPEPDVAVVRGTAETTPECTGRTPPATGRGLGCYPERDRIRKTALYADAGVAEYWIVNLQDRVLEVHRDPAAGAYRTKTTLASGESMTPIHAPEASIPVADLLP